MSRSRYLIVVAVATACGSAAALACGPHFRPWILMAGSDAPVLTAPQVRFRDEIGLLYPAPPGGPPTCNSDDADAHDLTEALRAQGLDSASIDATVAQARDFRARIADAARTEAGRPDLGKRIDVPPRGLPEEFALHLRGRAAWAQGDADVARASWNSVLALPEAERRWRSTWAAYMLGRSRVDHDPKKASAAFALCRDLASHGFADTDHLAAASYGWEARAWYLVGDYSRAIDLYLAEDAAGRDAAGSLRIVARAASQLDTPALRRLADSTGARRVLTAYAVSASGAPDSGWARRWLDAVDSAGSLVERADRLAWIAYTAGDFAAAERWVAKAPTESPLAAWTASKLRLREGRLDEAAALLAKAMRGFEGSHDDLVRQHGEEFDESAWARTSAELGAVEVCRGHFVEALDLLLRARYGEDAVYVAERVLTVDELREYVDRRLPGLVSEPDASWESGWMEHPPGELRSVLARRLTRNGRWREAVPYFDADVRPLLDEYVTAIRDGANPRRSPSARATSLRTAARLARDRGPVLLGTENGPDWEGWGVPGNQYTSPRVPPADCLVALRPGADETARYAASAPSPDRRYHYAFTAADHAWAAAQLMPDESDETAAWLCEAGSWLKYKDPKAAERFYKALVRRCGTTALGREAARVRWFPK